VVGAHELRNRFGWYLERVAAGEDIRVTRRGRPYVRLMPEEANLAHAATPPASSAARDRLALDEPFRASPSTAPADARAPMC